MKLCLRMHFESSVKNSPFLFLFSCKRIMENQHPSHGDWSFNLEKHKVTVLSSRGRRDRTKQFSLDATVIISLRFQHTFLEYRLHCQVGTKLEIRRTRKAATSMYIALTIKCSLWEAFASVWTLQMLLGHPLTPILVCDFWWPFSLKAWSLKPEKPKWAD